MSQLKNQLTWPLKAAPQTNVAADSQKGQVLAPSMFVTFNQL
jgi:hypothetical protein